MFKNQTIELLENKIRELFIQEEQVYVKKFNKETTVTGIELADRYIEKAHMIYQSKLIATYAMRLLQAGRELTVTIDNQIHNINLLNKESIDFLTNLDDGNPLIINVL